MTAETKDFEIVARFWNVVDGNERKTVIIFVEDGTKSTDDFGTIGRERQCQQIGISRADKDADIFWRIIQNHFTAPDLFANIEDTEPDETDLAMLKEIEHNPDCHEFISQEELMKELNIEI